MGKENNEEGETTFYVVHNYCQYKSFTN